MPSFLRIGGLCAVLAVPVLRGPGISEARLAPPAPPATRAPQPTPGQAPVSYRLTFPEPEHHWLQAEVTFPDVGSAPLQVRMSRSSPGRYALHEFAKNVFDVHAFDGSGRELSVSQPNLHQWDVPGHDGTVRIAYRLFGDVVDGTYLAVDTTHAHLNMPATLMWARGLEDRPATVRFEPPAARRAWNVATQLFPSSEPGTFTAPNLQYLMDSPSEFSAFTMRRFTVGDGVEFRVAVHHDGSEAEVERYAEDVKKIVEQAGRIYLEFPAFDVGYYTFIADYLPWAEGDGMEHRNSTVLASSGALRNPRERVGMLGTAAHEVFHCWNVERIRPASLEPFNFDEVNVSGELWLAEGFTSYYGPLLMHRAGLSDLGAVLRSFADGINAVTNTPGRRFRSAVDMSRQAPFVDGARSVDRTNRDHTFLSYYTYGAAIGLGLDLALRWGRPIHSRTYGIASRPSRLLPSRTRSSTGTSPDATSSTTRDSSPEPESSRARRIRAAHGWAT